MEKNTRGTNTYTHKKQRTEQRASKKKQHTICQGCVCVEMREHMINYVDGTTKNNKVSLLSSCVKRLQYGKRENVRLSNLKETYRYQLGTIKNLIIHFAY